MSAEAQHPVSSVPRKTVFRDLVGNLARLSSATLISQVIAIVASPILLRVYVPQEYGVYLAMSVLCSLGSAIVTLRFELAIQATRSLRRVVALASVALYAALGLTAALTAFAFSISPMLTQLLNVDLERFLYFLPASLAATATMEVFRSIHWRFEKYGIVATAVVTSAVVVVAMQLLLGVIGFGSHGILLGAIVGQFAGVLVLFLGVRKLRILRPSSVATLVATAAKFRAYPMVTTPAGFLHMLASIAPAAAVSAVFGSAVAGLFYLGSRLVSAPVAVLSGAVHPMFMGAAGKLHDHDPSALRSLFVRFATGLLVLMSPAILLFAYGQWLFGIVFGQEWHLAGSFAAWIAVGAAFHLAATSTSILTVLRYNTLHAKWVAAHVTLVGASVVAISSLPMNALEGVAVISVATAVSYALLLVLNYSVLSRLVTVTPPVQGL